jgi:hypothetical protein
MKKMLWPDLQQAVDRDRVAPLQSRADFLEPSKGPKNFGNTDCTGLGLKVFNDGKNSPIGNNGGV